MNVIVIGATGGSGRAACEALLDRGHSVTAVSRHASHLPAHERLRRLDLDASDVRALDRALPGHDAVVVTLGISEPAVRVRLRGPRATLGDIRSRGTAAVVDAARRAGIRRIVVQSSYGVGETRDRLTLADRVLFALLIRPQIVDSEIQEGVLRGSDLDWTIVQPVYLTDTDDIEHHVSEDGTVRGRRVSRAAVARVHAELVETGASVGRTVSVSG
ncbi:SDR family oxidoreductase [Microbacterium sp. ET2]|uniref:NAD(P)-dependent oxidoreductase n=1 Tax=Microbacterium albipurpureum TaxID=3050384 RepID=UPI00259CE53B|nr:NAD(P)-binding oxidoreductase [Microbacterium sp. ET2 (Ac-2212)]WJL95262.1 SDR family oxidoreductase [Microbacterium sp. ET2 (Ac-2212)]